MYNACKFVVLAREAPWPINKNNFCYRMSTGCTDASIVIIVRGY